MGRLVASPPDPIDMRISRLRLKENTSIDQEPTSTRSTPSPMMASLPPIISTIIKNSFWEWSTLSKVNERNANLYKINATPSKPKYRICVIY